MIFKIKFSQIPETSEIYDAGTFFVAVIDGVFHQVVWKRDETVRALSSLAKKSKGPLNLKTLNQWFSCRTGLSRR